MDANLTPEEIEQRTKSRILKHVTFKWRELVCTCYNPSRSDDINTCADCGKFSRWRLWRCNFCKETYVAGAFTHHIFDREDKPNLVKTTRGEYTASHLCYKCICKVHPARPTDQGPTYETVPVRNIDDILSDGFDDFGDFTL